MSSKPISVAVVGCNIGKAQVAAFQSLPAQFSVQAVCDLDLAKAARLSADCGIPDATADFGELCRREDIEVLSLCTPPRAHYEQIVQGLRAGKHVICEKPLVGSLKEVDELAQVEAATGRRIIPIFQNRFGHGLQKLKFLVEQGLAGTPYLATVETAWRRGPDYYEVGWRGTRREALGGCLLQQGIHAHDAFSYIVGRVQNVFALGATRVNSVETEDCAAAAVQMADGSLATFAVTLGSMVEITRHRFCFSRLLAESNSSPYANMSDPWTFRASSEAEDRTVAEALRAFIPRPEGYMGQFSRLHEALRTGSPMPVSLADARASIELVTALYDSIQRNAPTSLPILPTHPRYAGWNS